MRVLALDYGSARIGCAVSDATGTLATPVEAIAPPDVDVVAAMARKREVERIVVGMPVTLAGEEGGQAEVTRQFCSDLEHVIDIRIDTYDERFTTRMAAQTRRSSGSGSSEDSIAAAHLLETYLASIAREQAEGEDR